MSTNRTLKECADEVRQLISEKPLIKVDETPEERKKRVDTIGKQIKSIVKEGLLAYTRDNNVPDDLVFLVHEMQTKRHVSETSPGDKFIAHVAAAGGATLSEVFEMFELGKIEAKSAIRAHMLKSRPIDRVWINYLPEEKRYILVGTGEAMPEGYNGFIPKGFSLQTGDKTVLAETLHDIDFMSDSAETEEDITESLFTKDI